MRERPALFVLVLLLLSLTQLGRAHAQERWNDVYLIAMNFHNAGDDSVDLVFTDTVCSSAPDPRTLTLTRAGSTNFKAMISALSVGLLGKFRLDVSTEPGTCRLLNVWLKRGW